MRLKATIKNQIKKLYPSFTAKIGPYRFLAKKWKVKTGVNFVSNVLGTEFFRHNLISAPLDMENYENILILAPHQDDETIGAGGAMFAAYRNGCRITVIFITDGAQKMGWVPPEQIARIREQEAIAACSMVDAKIYNIGVSNLNPNPDIDDISRLSDLVRTIRPDALFIPWLLDYPPKHRMVNHLLWCANRIKKLPMCEVWGYQVNNMLYPNGCLNISDAIDDKIRMLQCYSSQNENFLPNEHTVRGLAAWNSRFLPRTNANIDGEYAELFSIFPIDEFLALVERFYFTDFSETYAGKKDVMRTMQKIHGIVSKM